MPGGAEVTTKKAIFKDDSTIERHFTANKRPGADVIPGTAAFSSTKTNKGNKSTLTCEQQPEGPGIKKCDSGLFVKVSRGRIYLRSQCLVAAGGR